MKAEKSGKKKNRGDSDDLAEMRDAFRNHNERQKGGGGGGKNDWDKLRDGKNLRRFLPWPPGDRKFYTEGWTHFDIGPNNRAVRCIDEAHIDDKKGVPTTGTKCPICKKFLREQSRINSEYKKGDKDGHAEWKRAKDKFVPRHQYYSNVLRPDEDDEESVEIKLLAYGPQVWGQLMNFYLGDDSDVGDFTHPKSGRWLNVKKESKGGSNRRNVEYRVFSKDQEDISDSWDSIKEQLHDLDAAAGKVASKEEVIAIMKGIDPDKDEDSDDDSDEDGDDDDDKEDDDEDEERPSKKSKLSKKMKRRDEDDDDDDEESDEDED